MSKQGTFESILDRKSSDVEAPKPAPVGEYRVMVAGLPREDKSTKKQTPFIEFTLKFIEALDSVDEDALEEWLGKDKITDRTIRHTLYLTEASLFRLVKFLDHLDAGDEDMTLSQRIAESPNKEVIITIRHEPSEDGETMFARIGSTAKAS